MIKIEFSGTDGSGKTTAVKYFVELAKSQGYSVVETREVGNPHIPSCVKMREFVLDPNNNLTGEAMELIFSAMRFENDKWLRNLLNSENTPDLVVSDRGWADHLAYTEHNVSKQFVEECYTQFVENHTMLPNLVLYFSVNTETALQRRVKRGTTDVIEMKGIEYQNLVRDSFVTYLETMAERGIVVKVIDANQSLEGVREQLDNILEELPLMFEE